MNKRCDCGCHWFWVSVLVVIAMLAFLGGCSDTSFKDGEPVTARVQRDANDPCLLLIVPFNSWYEVPAMRARVEGCVDVR